MFNRVAWTFAIAVAASMPIAEVSALSYSAKPITAQVIDAETGRPVPDVIVLVTWQLENVMGRWGGFFHWEETVTDADGRFTFAGWGIKEVPRSPEGRVLRMGTDQPTLYFYKSGYRVASADNFLETWMLGNPNWTGDPVRGSEVSGTQIKLERFQGTDLQYVRHLFSAASRLPLNNCQWARIPRLTAALVLEQQRHPWDRGKELPTLQRLEQQSALETGCPGIEVLKPYLK